MAGNQNEQFASTVANTVSEIVKAFGGERTSGKAIPNSKVRRAVIAAVNGDGTYRVSVVGADSSTQQFSLDGVKPWGSSTHEVGEKVLLAYEGSRPIPWIISGGGSSGSISTGTVIVGYIRFFS